MTGPRAGSCHLPFLPPSSEMEVRAGEVSGLPLTIPSRRNSFMGETGSGRGAQPLNIPEERAGEVWVGVLASKWISCARISLGWLSLEFWVRHTQVQIPSLPPVDRVTLDKSSILPEPQIPPL